MFSTIKKITELNPSSEDLLSFKDKYSFQEELTKKLDQKDADFDQAWINEIVLWKTNRYAKLSEKTLELLNQIDRNAEILDEAFTKEVLTHLLDEPGVRLPMASTILRFINPNIYQIIDQRVYRVIYAEELKLSTNIESNINQYLRYLGKLRETCRSFNIPYCQADRILYEYDKEVNKDVAIKY